MEASRIYETWARVAAIEESVVSADGRVEVTVDARGDVRSLVLDPAIYRDRDGEQLAATIIATVSTAAELAHERAHRAMAPVLPRDGDDLAFDPILNHLGGRP